MLKAHASLLHSYTTSTAKERVKTDAAFNKTVQICRVPFVSSNVHVYLTVKTQFEQSVKRHGALDYWCYPRKVAPSLTANPCQGDASCPH